MSRSVNKEETVGSDPRRVAICVLVILLIWILAVLDINIFRHLTGAAVILDITLAVFLSVVTASAS